MEQKHVSFNVAKAIKEAGYPQYGHCDEYYNSDGHVVDKSCDMVKLVYPRPTYLSVWLWLWREKKYRILLSASNQRWSEVHGIVTGVDGETCTSYHRGVKAYDVTNHKSNYSDPEEVVIAAIEYLVENNLIIRSDYE